MGRDDHIRTVQKGVVRLYEHAIDNAIAVLSGGSSGGTCHVVNPEVLRS